MTSSTGTTVACSIAIGLVVGRSIGARRPLPRSVAPEPQRRRTQGRRRRGLRQVVAAASALAVAFVVHPAVSIAAITVAASAPRVARVRRTRDAARAVDRALPDAIELLVLLVQAGLTPHQAVEVMAERGPEPTRIGFASVVTAIRRGDSLADALGALPTMLGTEATSIADALGLAARHGLPLGPTLEQLARDARLRRRRHAEADARTLPVRLSFPLVACTLPSFVLIAIAPAVLAALSSLGDTTL